MARRKQGDGELVHERPAWIIPGLVIVGVLTFSGFFLYHYFGPTPGEILGRVTISVGVSMLQPGDDRDRLIERADACLYAAKRNGRNRVICEADPEFSPTERIQVA